MGRCAVMAADYGERNGCSITNRSGKTAKDFESLESKSFGTIHRPQFKAAVRPNPLPARLGAEMLSCLSYRGPLRVIVACPFRRDAFAARRNCDPTHRGS